MKIKEVQITDHPYVFKVFFTPNWIEKLFEVQEKSELYKDTGSNYMCGGGAIYWDKDCDPLGNMSSIGEAIDKFRNKW